MGHELYRLLGRLDEARAFYRLDRPRNDSVLITVTFVGERLELDVFEDGHVEASRFRGDESVISDGHALAVLDDLLSEQG